MKNIKQNIKIIAVLLLLFNLLSCGIFEGHSSIITSIAISSNGNYIASGSMNGSIIFWDLNKLIKYQWYYWHGGSIKSIQFSPDESCVLLASSPGGDNKIIMHDLKGNILKIIKTSFITTQVFFLSDNLIISGDTDGKLNLYSKQGQLIKNIKAFDSEIENIVIDKNNKVLYVTSFKNSLIKKYDFNLNYIDFIKLSEFIWGITAYDNYQFLLVGLNNGKIQKISLSNNFKIEDMDSHNESVDNIITNSVNGWIITSSRNQIKIRDNSFNLKKIIYDYKSIGYMTYSPAGNFFVIGTERYDLLIFNNNFEIIEKFALPDYCKQWGRIK